MPVQLLPGGLFSILCHGAGLTCVWKGSPSHRAQLLLEPERKFACSLPAPLLALCWAHRPTHCSAPWMTFTPGSSAIPLDCRLPWGRQVCFLSHFSSPHTRHLLVLVKVHLIGMNEFTASGPCTQRKFKSFDYIINHSLHFSLLPVLPISVTMPSQTPGSHLGVILLLLLTIHSFIHSSIHLFTQSSVSSVIIKEKM